MRCGAVGHGESPDRRAALRLPVRHDPRGRGHQSGRRVRAELHVLDVLRTEEHPYIATQVRHKGGDRPPSSFRENVHLGDAEHRDAWRSLPGCRHHPAQVGVRRGDGCSDPARDAPIDQGDARPRVELDPSLDKALGQRQQRGRSRGERGCGERHHAVDGETCHTGSVSVRCLGAGGVGGPAARTRPPLRPASPLRGVAGAGGGGGLAVTGAARGAVPR